MRTLRHPTTRPPRLTLLLTSLFVVLSAAPAAAADIFVDNIRGNDEFDGSQDRSSAGNVGPVRTINRALRICYPADRIVLADTGQPYREAISLSAGRHSGTAVQPFVIQGNGAVLDGSEPIPPRAWKNYSDNIFRYRPARLGHQMLFLDDRPATSRGIDLTGNELPALMPLEWCGMGQYIYFRTELGSLPDFYNLSHAVRETGITLYHVRHVRIENLTVQGFRIDGINARDLVDDCVISQVVARGNGRAGITAAGASRIVLESCLVGNNTEAQLLSQGESITTLRNCELLPESAPAVVDEGGKVIVEQPEAQ